MDFIGRSQELKSLEEQFNSRRFEFTVIYGRRRVGKTWLIRKYVENKPAVFFTGLEAGASPNLESMSKAVHKFTGQTGQSSFRSFETLFDFLAEYARSSPLVFIIDEFPYLAAAAPEISSLLQRYCDHEWQNTRLHLILCGSSMSFMERQVLGTKSPLYGRRTAQVRLSPFTFFETRSFLSAMSMEDAAILHAATGGVAEYLSFVDPSHSLADNLTGLFLSSKGRLFEEPSNLLKQELREPRVYNDILDAIANGASRYNEICTKIHIQSGALSRYLEALCDLGITEKEQPMLSPGSKKVVYRIEDGCFRFWYRFVMPNTDAIVSGLGSQVYEQIVAPALSSFMGQGFERIFFDYFDRWNQNGELPGLVTARGRWWGNTAVDRREEEIDLLGVGTNFLVFGEAKWRNERTDMGVIQDLERKGQLFLAVSRHYILFSRSGFTEGAQRYASERDDIRLVVLLDAEYTRSRGEGGASFG